VATGSAQSPAATRAGRWRHAPRTSRDGEAAVNYPTGAGSRVRRSGEQQIMRRRWSSSVNCSRPGAQILMPRMLTSSKREDRRRGRQATRGPRRLSGEPRHAAEADGTRKSRPGVDGISNTVPRGSPLTVGSNTCGSDRAGGGLGHRYQAAGAAARELEAACRQRHGGGRSPEAQVRRTSGACGGPRLRDRRRRFLREQPSQLTRSGPWFRRLVIRRRRECGPCYCSMFHAMAAQDRSGRFRSVRNRSGGVVLLLCSSVQSSDLRLVRETTDPGAAMHFN